MSKQQSKTHKKGANILKVAKTYGKYSQRAALLVLLIGVLGLSACSLNQPAKDSPTESTVAQQDESRSQQEKQSTSQRPYRDPNVVIGGKKPDKDQATGEQKIEPTVVAYEDFYDPLISVNRAVFSFNNASYRYVIIPVAKAYDYSVPRPVKHSVSNFFHNIKMPIYAINKLLQGEGKNAGVSVLRFGINTTVGLLGLFDPAKSWFELERQNTGFGDTLASYKAGYGMYLVLPILGPSDIRTGTGTIVDIFTNPIPHVIDQPAASAIQAGDYVQQFAPSAERYTELYEKSEDPYLFFRNLHLQGLIRDLRYE